ncbi:MAG: YihY/virulence factor BrkB family protein [Acidobacteria bacterium]|nr:YihY/virulence factor BrkB family protein [Acidobacteriota bacterium]
MKLPSIDLARWVDLAQQLRVRDKSHNGAVVSAGVAFFALIALVPALIATVSLYALIGNPQDIERQINEATSALPEEASALIAEQMIGITSSASSKLSLTLALGIVLALWSASAATRHLISTLNTCYEIRETRSFVKVRVTALVFTFGAIVVVVGSAFMLAALPVFVANTGLGSGMRMLVNVALYPMMGALMIAVLGVLYRFGPAQRLRPTYSAKGALLATIIWLTASIGFAVFSAYFSDFKLTYGALSAVVVLMLWIYLGAYAVIVGAEFNALLARRSV